MIKSNSQTPGLPASFSNHKHGLSVDEVAEIQARLDQMLDLAWSVMQTIAKDPAKLAELRRHLTELKKLDPISERSSENRSDI